MTPRYCIAALCACLLTACDTLPDNFTVETPQGKAAEAAYQRCLADGEAAVQPTRTEPVLNIAIDLVHACRPQLQAFESALVSSNVGMRDSSYKAGAFIRTYERASIDRVAAVLAQQRGKR